MKKSLLILFFLFLFFPFFQVSAQKGEDFQGLKFSCLDINWCHDKDACSVGNVHRARLTAGQTKAAVGSRTYLTECIEIAVDQIRCTTGNQELDNELFCPSDNPSCQIPNLNDLKNTVGYSLEVNNENVDRSYGIYHLENGNYVKKDLHNKQSLMLQSDAFGNITPMAIEWQSYTPKEIIRKFIIWNKVTTKKNVDAEGSGQKQGTLEFLFSQSSCSGQSWDPYGRVFDSVTLEPIPDVQVSINQFDSTNPDTPIPVTSANPNIINPYVTIANSNFSFIVVDGVYSLTPEVVSYIHPVKNDVDILSLSQNASKIYSNFYYSDSPKIVQQGKIQQRDIVMKPVDANGLFYPGGYHYNLEVLSKFEEVSGGQIVYTGQLSHPFALVNIYKCLDATFGICPSEPYQRIDTVVKGGPDKFGKFKFSLPQRELENGERFKVEFVKRDLQSAANLGQGNPVLNKIISWIFNNLVSKNSVQAQESIDTVTTFVNPIPLYLEGYAYDNQGDIMPAATVGIYVNFSPAPIYQKSADANGFFRITSENIPNTQYSLRFTSADNPQNISYQTTSQFIANNSNFIQAEKIDIYRSFTSTNNPRRNITPSYIPQQKINALVTLISPTPKQEVSQSPIEQAPSQETIRNPIYLAAAIMLILVGGIGVMLAIYVYKKKKAGGEAGF